MSVLTKYISLYELDGENTLMLNALFGAIDVIDTETKGKIERIKSMENLDEKFIGENLMKSLRNRDIYFLVTRKN
ncbi:MULTISPECIES: hypothetical protein [Clostridium]|uniref:Uncharacterized protein n=1 Tax=Clostridium cibarium TaxID=2762247 RepID=A0ABR8PYU1_9CLOT|nr:MULTISPECIES: hypothetical protein [Clostridium]MBD7913334.1 hypothetical protein [Clostridium cibarium]